MNLWTQPLQRWEKEFFKWIQILCHGCLAGTCWMHILWWKKVEYFFIDSKIPALKCFQWQSRNRSRDWPDKYLRFRSEQLARVSKRESWAPKPKRRDVSVDHSDVSERPWNQDVELLIFCQQLTHSELMAQITTRVFHFYSQIWTYALIFIALAFP